MASSTEEKVVAFPQSAWRFSPDDGYLIVDCLLKKVNNQPIREQIIDVYLRQEDPEALIKTHPKLGDKEWYFFTPIDRKYPKGSQPDRRSKTGFWKATGCNEEIYSEGKLVGFKKKLVFYRGEAKKAQKEDKTNLIMKEYRLNIAPRVKTSPTDMRLDDWVLCKIYEKASKARRCKPMSNPSSSSSGKRKRDNVGGSSAVPQNVVIDDYQNRYVHSSVPNPTPVPDPSLVNGGQQYPQDCYRYALQNRYVQSFFPTGGYGDGGQYQDLGDPYVQSGYGGQHHPHLNILQNSANPHPPVPVSGYGQQQQQHLFPQNHPNLLSSSEQYLPAVPVHRDHEQHHRDSIFFETQVDQFITYKPIDHSTTTNNSNASDITFTPYTPKDRPQ